MNAPNTDELDAQDMQRLAEGQDAALDSLMERHAERLFHYLIRCLQNEEDAADLAQETFVKLYQSRARFDRRQRFSTWLYSIASNLVKDRYRWRSRHPQVSLDAENQTGGDPFRNLMPATGLAPNESIEAAERADAVRRAIRTLPDDLRLPLILAEYEDQSHAEIAAAIGCTVKAVETRIHRARQRLRASLAALLETV